MASTAIPAGPAAAPAFPPSLPAGYHVENLTRLLETVYEQYSDLLDAEERALYQGFQRLTPPAKSLYCRLLTRRGPLLRRDKLHYDDVPDRDQALQELAAARMIEDNPPHPPEQLLALLTRRELVALFRPQGHQGLAKDRLIQRILQRSGAATIQQRITAQFPYVEPCYQRAFTTFKLCFFGNSRQDLSEFVISDLGHVQYEPYPLHRSQRHYVNRHQIECHLRYSEARERLDDPELLADPAALQQLARDLPPPDDHPYLNRRFQKLLIRIARQLERLQQLEPALQWYRRCDLHPARERQARILAKQGQPEAALALCRRMARDGQHPEELEFAARFARRLEGKNRRRSADASWREWQLSLPPGELTVERLAAAALSDSHHHCLYLENLLLTGLFGLYFWDLIFAPLPGAFINPFQREPLDLASEDFYPRRRTAIDRRLAQLQGGDWQPVIWHHFHCKQGLANPFVIWPVFNRALLELVLARIPAAHLQPLFQRILTHPGLHRNGFPDLIRFSATGYELIEVKGPGDKLQPNQIRWLKYFQHHGIPASVCHVAWAEDD
ncbi:MAG: hypothetical protein CML06_03695 [Pseudomonadales bacterium]|nr:hypothetical protein [Pseudomonadales bacterium]